jgi:hypothetical protein
MPELEVVIAEVLPKKSEKAPHAAKDGNGLILKAWSEAKGNGFALGPSGFEPYVGKTVRVGYEPKSREWEGKTYTDNFITSFEEVVSTEPPAMGTGDYVVGQKAPSDKRGINAAVALKAAVAALSHTIKTDATPKEASERILPLAGSFNLWLSTTSGLDIGDDRFIPFGDE